MRVHTRGMTQVWGATTRGAPTWPLAVKSHQVVRRDDDPGDRGVATEAGVAPVPIVVMQPFGELEPPLARVTKPAGIGPLVECGLDEALGLAVRARSVRPREEVANPEPLTGLTKAPRSIARAVIRHDGPHAHPEASQAAHRAVQKADGGPPRSSGRTSAVAQRVASSMATCVNSQPAPRTVSRRLPLMRWPGRTMRPSFLMSRCTSAPLSLRS